MVILGEGKTSRNLASNLPQGQQSSSGDVHFDHLVEKVVQD